MRELIIQAARGWIGVKWRHQGRTRIRGVDCFGLLYMVSQDIGHPVEDEYRYSRVPDGFSFEEGMRRRFTIIPIEGAVPGDILVFSEIMYPCHAGILATNRHGVRSLIHSHAGRRRVCEESLQQWEIKLRMAFRWRCVDG